MTDTLGDLALVFLRQHPGPAAAVLEQVDPDEAAQALLPLEVGRASQVLMRMNMDAAARTLRCMDDGWARDTLLEADFVQAARWLSHLDDEASARLLAGLPAQSQRNIVEALEFPVGTAGHLMDPRVTTFREDTTVDEALLSIRKTRGRKITDVVLTDDEGKLTGVVSLQSLVGAPDNAPMGSLADRDRPVVNPMATRDEVVDLLNRHALTSLSVVDLDGRLLGILPYDALVRAAQQAATDDLQQMVGAGKDERALSPAAIHDQEPLTVAADQSRHRLRRRLGGRLVRCNHRQIHGAGRADAGGGWPGRKHGRAGAGGDHAWACTARDPRRSLVARVS